MRIAVIGSRNIINLELKNFLPKNITLLITGGAKGIDTLAENYSDKNKIPKLIFLPDYDKYGKSAPLIRNKLIVENADEVIAIWDGVSRGTKFSIDYAKLIGKPVKVFIVK